MSSHGYYTRPAYPSRRSSRSRKSDGYTRLAPCDDREVLREYTRAGLDQVQQTYIKPIWEYDPAQYWTRRPSPRIPPLEAFLAEARAKYNYGSQQRINPVPEYWTVGGYQYGYPEGYTPPETIYPLSYHSSGRSRRSERSSTLIGTDSRRVSSTLVDSNRSSLNRSQRESRSQRNSRSTRDSRRVSSTIVEPSRNSSNPTQRAARTSRPRAQTPHPRVRQAAYSRIPEPAQPVSTSFCSKQKPQLSLTGGFISWVSFDFSRIDLVTFTTLIISRDLESMPITSSDLNFLELARAARIWSI